MNKSFKSVGIKLIQGLVAGIMLLCFSFPSFAHYASLTVDNYNPAPNEEITINIGWGHKFPGDGKMKKVAYEKTNLEVIDPQGRKKTITIIPEAEEGNKPIKVKFENSGNYTILLSQKNFSTKTTEGYKYQPKNALKNVIHSKWSETVSKAAVTVGSIGKELHSPDSKDRFQIIPMGNPLKLGKGNFLAFKVTLDGKPWQGIVYATYEGFSDSEDTFAYTTKTDKDGIAKIKILEKGLWLIKADHSYPYEKKEEADEYSLKATLTFKN